MFRRFVGLQIGLLVCSLIGLSGIQVSAGEPSEQAKTVHGYLKSEGYSPEFDKDGDIVFKREGKTYLVIFDKEDAEYYRIVFPNFWSIDSSLERLYARSAIEEVNNSVKVARIYMRGDNTHATVELFCEDARAFTKMLKRSISALEVSVTKFSLQMVLEAAK